MVESALALGYRHIDTAQMYGKQDAVGNALAATNVHLSSKGHYTIQTSDGSRAAFADSLDELKTDYLDVVVV